MCKRLKQASRIWSRSPWLVLGIAASFLGSWSCANQARCDPGFELEGSSCARVAGEIPEDPDGASGAGGAPAEHASCDPSAAPVVEFGTPCTDGVMHSDCGCPAPVCAIQAGATQGFCTQIDCVRSPEVCPAGWSCFDLSAIDPSYPPLCVAP
jgi:hypothetical protein